MDRCAFKGSVQRAVAARCDRAAAKPSADNLRRAGLAALRVSCICHVFLKRESEREGEGGGSVLNHHIAPPTNPWEYTTSHAHSRTLTHTHAHAHAHADTSSPSVVLHVACFMSFLLTCKPDAAMHRIKHRYLLQRADTLPEGKHDRTRSAHAGLRLPGVLSGCF